MQQFYKERERIDEAMAALERLSGSNWEALERYSEATDERLPPLPFRIPPPLSRRFLRLSDHQPDAL